MVAELLYRFYPPAALEDIEGAGTLKIIWQYAVAFCELDQSVGFCLNTAESRLYLEKSLSPTFGTRRPDLYETWKRTWVGRAAEERICGELILHADSPAVCLCLLCPTSLIW